MSRQEPQFAKKDSDEDKSEASLAKRAMDALNSGKISEED